MYELDIKPSDALPILDHSPSEWLEDKAKSGNWNEVPRTKVFQIPEDNQLRIIFDSPYVVFDGLKRRATAMKYNLPYRVIVLGGA